MAKNNIYGEQVTTAFATSDSGVIIGTGQDQMDLVGIIKYDKMVIKFGTLLITALEVIK